MSYLAIQRPLGSQFRGLGRQDAARVLSYFLPRIPNLIVVRGARVASRVAWARGIMTPRYTRVYLDGVHDVERAYQLLPAYIANPDLALSVKEFVLGQNWCDVSESSPRVSDAEHASIEIYV